MKHIVAALSLLVLAMPAAAGDDDGASVFYPGSLLREWCATGDETYISTIIGTLDAVQVVYYNNGQPKPFCISPDISAGDAANTICNFLNNKLLFGDMGLSAADLTLQAAKEEFPC